MKIQFLKDTSKAIISGYPENTLLVCHEMYTPPKLDGVQYVEWQRFKVTYSEYNPNLIILVGLNRMINPATRCDRINDYLQILTPNIAKMSIDSAPFIGEPWRFWYHYSVAFSSFMGVNYSYPIEGEWQKWFYRETNECRLQADNLKLFITNTYCDLPKLKTRFDFYDPSDPQTEWYAEAKTHTFAKYNTPKLLITNLLKLANDHFQLDINFDSYLKNVSFKLPELGIYRFMAEENQRRLEIYNAFCNETI